MGERLDGTVFANDQLNLTLPIGRTLDDLNGISVWCSDFNADFGSVTFASTTN